MHAQGRDVGTSIEAGDITLWIVEAHQMLDTSNEFEGLSRRSVQILLRSAIEADFDKGS